MSEIRQLPEVNVGSEGMGNGADDGSTTLAAFRKAELELMVMTMKSVIEPVLGPLIRRVVIEPILEPLTHRVVIEPIFEPLIRRVVKEELIGLMQQGILPSLRSLNQNTGNETHRSEPRNLELRFRNKLLQQFWTGNHIKGEDGASSVEIALVDVVTGHVVNSGLEVEIVLLRVDRGDEGHDWTTEEFNGKIVREWKGKPFLKGNTFLNLKEGVGLIDEISFTHSKNSVPITKFRLGVRTKDDFNGVRVREAKSEIFALKDSRSKRNKKHYPPSLDDELWRLKKIVEDGDFHKHLSQEKVYTVEDFLKLHFTDPTRLRNVLNTIVEHGLTCKLDDQYLYSPPGSPPRTGVVFNEVGQLVGRLFEGQYIHTDRLSEKEKDDAQKLVVSAFQNWRDVVRYDESSLSPGSSHLVTEVVLPSNSPRLEIPTNGSNVGNDHFQPIPSPLGIIPTDNPQPSTSSQGIISPENYPLERTWSDELLQGFSPDFWENFRLCLDNNNSHAVNDSEESPATNPHTAEIRVDAQAVAIGQTKGRRLWSMALSFSRRVRTSIEDSDHVQKKQRLH